MIKNYRKSIPAFIIFTRKKIIITKALKIINYLIFFLIFFISG